MRVAVRPVFVGVPVLLAIALAAILAPLWMSGAGGGANFTEKAALTGLVEITVRGPDGLIKFHQIMANSPTSDFREAAADRLFTSGGLGATGTYDAIQLCQTSIDPCTTGQLVTPLGTALDTGITNNPAVGAVTDSPAEDPGAYQVDETFFCNSTDASDCNQILELQLVAGDHTGGTADIDIGAVQSVSVTLSDNDSLAITWTITIN